MNKYKLYGPKKRVIFVPGEIVKFSKPGCRIIGVVVKDKMYKLPTTDSVVQYSNVDDGKFNIKTLICYSYSNSYAVSFKNVGEVGGEFSHSNWNNLTKLNSRQIKRLGMRLILATYE